MVFERGALGVEYAIQVHARVGTTKRWRVQDTMEEAELVADGIVNNWTYSWY